MDLSLRKSRAGKSHNYRGGIVYMVYKKFNFQSVFRPRENEKPAFTNPSGLKSVFEKLNFQNVFRPYENSKPAFTNSSGMKSVVDKLRFRDGVVWTVGLTVEIKLRLQISPA